MTGSLTLRRVPLKNVLAHPVRAAIILVLALAQAACVFGGLVALDGMRAQLSLAERRLGADIVDKRALSMLGTPAQCDQPRATLARMDANEEIAAVTYQLAISQTRPDGTTQWIIGYDPATDFVVSPWIAEGEGKYAPEGAVTVGAAAAQTPEGEVTLFGKQWPVGAHLEATGTDWDHAVFVSMDTLTQVIAASVESGVDTYASLAPDRDYTVALVHVADLRQVDSVTEWINLYVRKVTAVRSEAAVSATASDVRAHRSALLGVLGIAWGVLLAALMVAQATLMNERRHELYVWRSIGASAKTIARVMTAESLILHAAGALAGVVVGAAAVPLLGDASALAALTTPARSAPLAGLTVALLVAFGVAGTRLALARVAAAVQGQKLAPI